MRQAFVYCMQVYRCSHHKRTVVMTTWHRHQLSSWALASFSFFSANSTAFNWKGSCVYVFFLFFAISSRALRFRKHAYTCTNGHACPLVSIWGLTCISFADQFTPPSPCVKTRAPFILGRRLFEEIWYAHSMLSCWCARFYCHLFWFLC